MARPAGLAVEDVTVRFGGLVALDRVSFEAPPARITALIGPNGAGKTTTFNVCCGFQRPTQGRVRLHDRDVTGLRPAARARLGLGRTFQRMELFRSLTVRENVALAAEACHVDRDPLTQLGARRAGPRVRRDVDARTDAILDRLGLEAIQHRLAGELSTGQGRLAELARALARRPTVLLLDEPSSGLDHAETRRFGALLGRLVEEEDLAVVLVEHDVGLVLDVAAWVVVIEFGKLLFAGTPDDVRANPEVRRAYLGRRDAG